MAKKLILSLSAAVLALTACGGAGDGEKQSASDLKIYGGAKVAAEDEVAPYTVVLLQNNAPVCTGALIAPRLVVSAAHCAALIKKNRPAYIGFGLKAKEAKLVAVQNFVAHENFDAAAGSLGGKDVPVNDVGLIQLADDAPEGYAPVKLLGRSDSLRTGEPVVLAGFGKTDKKSGWFGTVLGELFQVETEVLEEAPLAKEVWFGNTPGKSACNGDSGGPALVRRQQELRLLGVTSRGRDCKSEVIYTDLRYFQDWIQRTAADFPS